ncbi:hypothetical protein [Marinobacter halotolerans]|uniref:hypothetical protein n=1 Tax=Marinobacter halotolerans TaxID=1569211 RepID=UPI0012453585|nr:hypothetical protein [Marinobacter halotolerans]
MKTSFILQVMAFGFLIAFVLSAVAGQATIEAQESGERSSIQLEDSVEQKADDSLDRKVKGFPETNF